MAITCDPKDPRTPRLVRAISSNARWIPFVFIIGLITYAYFTVALSLGIQYHLLRKGQYSKALSEVVVPTLLVGVALWSFVVAVFKHPGSPSLRGSSWGDEEVARSNHTGTYELQQGERNDVDDGAQAPLLSQATIPGQPQYPARSGRQQLDDLRTMNRNPARPVEGRSDIWVKSSGESRWCNKCNAPKPDRCHHCSSCQRCVLRMDHHCPWLANRCIGLRNHKAFFLFLAYTALFCAYCCQEMARALLIYVEQEQNGFESSPISWAIVLFLGFIFGASLLPFAGYHAYLICKNRTTIESMEGSGRVRLRVAPNPDRSRVQDRLRNIVSSSANVAPYPSQTSSRHTDPPTTGRSWRPDQYLSREERLALKRAGKLNVYDVGTGSNWTQIMGASKLLWFVPVGEPQGDGRTYLVSIPTLKKLEAITASIRIPGQSSRPPSRSRARQHSDGQYNDHDNEDDEDDDDSVYGRDYDADEHEQALAAASAANVNAPERDTGLYRAPGQQFAGAHGHMEWGDAPRKTSILFDVEDNPDAHYRTTH